MLQFEEPQSCAFGIIKEVPFLDRSDEQSKEKLNKIIKLEYPYGYLFPARRRKDISKLPERKKKHMYIIAAID